MIERIDVLGPLIADCTLPGETKADEVWPAHANGVPLSRDRWLTVYATRGYRFGDDDHSAVYQIRRDSPVGPVVKEGWFSRATDQWQPLEDGRKYFKQHGHPVAFGVPKGALIDSRRVAHENVFVAKWRILGIDVHKDGQWAGWTGDWPRRLPETQDVEWVQFRLNDAEDDIEVLQPPRPLRQKGCEGGRVVGFTPAGEPLEKMNQTFVPPVPFNADRSEWADVNHFPGGRLAALKYRFNPATGLYEWVQTGQVITSGHPEVNLFEASLIAGPDGWIIMARKALSHKSAASRSGSGTGAHEVGVAWIRAEDPFVRAGAPVFPQAPRCDNVPVTAFRAADGVIRLFGGDSSLAVGPQGRRNPLRCWDIDPGDFSASNHRVVFDALAPGGIPIRRDTPNPQWTPACDFAKLQPHQGGRQQYLLHRCHLNRGENAFAGIYHERIVYTQEHPPAWTFA